MDDIAQPENTRTQELEHSSTQECKMLHVDLGARLLVLLEFLSAPVLGFFYKRLSPCLIRILVDSAEKSERRTFAAPALTEIGYRECHKNPDI